MRGIGMGLPVAVLVAAAGLAYPASAQEAPGWRFGAEISAPGALVPAGRGYLDKWRAFFPGTLDGVPVRLRSVAGLRAFAEHDFPMSLPAGLRSGVRVAAGIDDGRITLPEGAGPVTAPIDIAITAISAEARLFLAADLGGSGHWTGEAGVGLGAQAAFGRLDMGIWQVADTLTLLDIHGYGRVTRDFDGAPGGAAFFAELSYGRTGPNAGAGVRFGF